MTRAHVLVVEDDHSLRDVLARALREEGYRVITAVDGAGALAAMTAAIGAVVLDIGLADSDGRDVCHALRARGFGAPVLFLTALDGMADRLTGFAAGGDDYLPKPFHLAELVARLGALLRRVPPLRGGGSAGLTLDPAAHAVVGPGGRVALTPTEYRLLGPLLASPGAVIRRRDLRRAGWPDGAIVHDNTLDQYVAKLRRKLGQAGAACSLETARGVGYRLS
ncbi:MAG TPA: response regulator transcription factor [Mycobacteriales bacterium]|jgi:two-component system response regulator MprA|nr:response regulator transcription factor [Mycobacteriales bacterium]